MPRRTDREPACLLDELSRTIRCNATVVINFLNSTGLPQLDFDARSTGHVPPLPSLQEARLRLISAARTLEDLMLGPEELLKSIQPNDVVALQAIYRYRIAQALAKDEQVSFEELSERVGLNTIDLKRLLRLAMTRHVFREPAAGVVAHTAASLRLAEDEGTYEWAGIITEERFPAAVRAVDSLQRFGQARDVTQCGFALANDPAIGLYQHLATTPPRRDRWSRAMSAIATEIDFNFILKVFDWAALPPGALVVDVGGGHGDVSIGLAARLCGKDSDSSANSSERNIHFMVQDLPETICGIQLDSVPHNVSFEPHNFFVPQPRHSAAVYYFRNVFHNWPDAQCVQILRAQVPAMATGSSLLIDDYALHEPLTAGAVAERQRRGMDVTMLIYFGSRERTVGEWVDLLKEADERFILRKTSMQPEHMSTIFEVGWHDA